jgi:hypothetical protein
MVVAAHKNGPLHVHIENTPVAGPYNVSVYIEGDYCPEHDSAPTAGSHVHSAVAPTRRKGATAETECGPDCMRETFTRILTTQVPVSSAKRQPVAGPIAKQPGKKRARPKRR